MLNLPAIQQALREFSFDGWLLCDFRGSNLLARRILQLGDDAITSRRFYYFVPAQGQPKKLVHRIESGVLDHLPGEKHVYLKWQTLEAELKSIVGRGRLAMEYSPRNAIPYISRVDAGTVELIKSFGLEVAPSGDLIQLFEAVWDDEQWAMHLESARLNRAAFDEAFAFIANRVRESGVVRETEVQQRIMDFFERNNLVTDHPPIVGVGPHSGDPHFAPSAENDGEIREGTFVLIDLWSKLNRPRSTISDYTRVGFVGTDVPEQYTKIFNIVRDARDAAIEFVRSAFAKKLPIQGWQVDQAARDVIEQAGYGEHFVHRTGHSIGQETHGNGANMDNLETHEERRVLPRTCFSIEPGIYLPEFGVRSEVDVFIDQQGGVHVTGGDPQTEVLAILGEF
jgi:Xaa-Pro aminopeptidase